MLLQPTIQKLHELRLAGMAKALEQQLKDPDIQALSFEDRLGLLIDNEATERESKKVASRLKAAKPKVQACLEDVKTDLVGGLDKRTLRQLALCHWARDHRNITVDGATGTGKTYLACSLINSACRTGFKALYYRAQRLFHATTMARADGSYTKLLTKLARIDVLVIDDFGHASVTDELSRDLLEIIDDRDTKSTIIVSQLPVNDWHQTFTNATIADAILDRIIHTAYKFSLDGESIRKLNAVDTKCDDSGIEF
jgi:DNA replication protein DnaC